MSRLFTNYYFLVCAVVFPVTMFLVAFDAAYAAVGKTTEGTITTARITSGRKGRGTKVLIEYKFTDVEGNERVGGEDLGDIVQLPQINGPIESQYLPHWLPETSRTPRAFNIPILVACIVSAIGLAVVTGWHVLTPAHEQATPGN